MKLLDNNIFEKLHNFSKFKFITPFNIEKSALTGLRFGTFGALKVVQARA